jgi:hypothetical protein
MPFPKYACLPFSSSPPAHIGPQSGWAEAITALAVLAGSWTIRTGPASGPPSGTGSPLGPAAGLPVILHSRR